MAIPTEVRSGSYIKGLAEVRIRDDAELVIVMDENGAKYTIPYDASDIGDIVNGRYRVTVSSDGTKIFSITPVDGTFIVRYDGMVTQDGNLPMPKLMKGGERKSKNGKGTWIAPDYLAFTVLLKVISNPNKRIKIPYNLNYSFEQYLDTKETLIPIGSSPLERTEKFLRVAGYDFSTDSIPWSENVLPAVDDTLTDRAVKFQVFMKNGYVDDIAPMPPILSDED